MPVLLVEHDIDRVFQLADAVTVMNDGQVLVDGTRRGRALVAAVQEVYIGSGTHALAEQGATERGAAMQPLLHARRASTPSTARATSCVTSTFDVRENEIVALLGRNGAGKSTVLKTIVGIAPPAPARIALAGERAGRPAVGARSRGAASPTCRRAAACSPA